MTSPDTLPPGWSEFDPNDHELSDDPAYQQARADARQRREARTEAYGALLREIRSRQNITQVMLSQVLEMVQSDISRLERQRDLKVSTLTEYLWALGAEDVQLQVTFPDEPPVSLELHPLSPSN